MNEKPDTFTARIISLGRITIPEEIRVLWNLTDGDLVTVKLLLAAKAEEVAVKEA